MRSSRKRSSGKPTEKKSLTPEGESMEASPEVLRDGPVRLESLEGGAVWRAVLNTPKANILDMEKCDILSEIFVDAARTRPLKAVIIGAEGPHFSFGASVQEHLPDAIGIVTADCDGQHCVEDIVAVAEKLAQGAGSPILGARTFGRDYPLLKRLGNKVTRSVMRTFYGLNLKDAQTGLRGIPMRLVPGLFKIPYNRYEFETEMLLALGAREAGWLITRLTEALKHSARGEEYIATYPDDERP